MNMKNHSNKLSITCVHLKDNSIGEYTIIKGKPDGKKDSGKIYFCKECFEGSAEMIKNNNIEKVMTVCEGCMKNYTWNKKYVKTQ